MASIQPRTSLVKFARSSCTDRPGIDDGIWWAMVTATTVGYGDLVPITPAGRFVSMIYMLVGLSLFSILSGFIASEFVHARSVSQGIQTVEGLTGLRVCGYPSQIYDRGWVSLACFGKLWRARPRLYRSKQASTFRPFQEEEKRPRHPRATKMHLT